MRSKRATQRKHASRRALQRHGLEISDRKRKAIKRAIHNLDSVFLYAQSKTRTMHAVKVDGKWVPVIYSKSTKEVVTVLTWEMVKENLHEDPRIARNLCAAGLGGLVS
jgi:hypothetical protein